MTRPGHFLDIIDLAKSGRVSIAGKTIGDVPAVGVSHAARPTPHEIIGRVEEGLALMAAEGFANELVEVLAIPARGLIRVVLAARHSESEVYLKQYLSQWLPLGVAVEVVADPTRASLDGEAQLARIGNALEGLE